jgi:hypothetical protein
MRDVQSRHVPFSRITKILHWVPNRASTSATNSMISTNVSKSTLMDRTEFFSNRQDWASLDRRSQSLLRFNDPIHGKRLGVTVSQMNGFPLM